MAKIAVIGHGTIGKRVVQVAPKYGYQVEAVFTSNRALFRQGDALVEDRICLLEAVGREGCMQKCVERGIKNVLIAIPSGGDGHAEMAYIRYFTSRGVRVVTAGKSALANQFNAIAHGIDYVGFDATVGGGTMIPSFLQEHLYVDHEHPFVMTAVINGTLNYAQTRVLDGVSAEQICNEALRLGFAEPPPKGQTLSPREMYVGEFDDIRRKLAIICNTRLRKIVGETLSQESFRISRFSGHDCAQVMASNSEYRYMVRICSRDRDLEFFNDLDVGGKIDFSGQSGNLWIVGGFVPLRGSLKKWVPDHVGNAVHLVQNGDTDIRIGQGAGPVPTVGAMMSNLRRFTEAGK